MQRPAQLHHYRMHTPNLFSQTDQGADLQVDISPNNLHADIDFGRQACRRGGAAACSQAGRWPAAAAAVCTPGARLCLAVA